MLTALVGRAALSPPLALAHGTRPCRRIASLSVRINADPTGKSAISRTIEILIRIDKPTPAGFLSVAEAPGKYVLTKIRIVNIIQLEVIVMPLKPAEMEKIILADGWVFKDQTGSHRHYTHPMKPGKVTIPFHKGKELTKVTEKSIRKQAGLSGSGTAIEGG